MKYRLLLVQIILLFSLSTYSQNGLFSIDGSIEGIANGYVQIWQPKSDSTFYVHENKFLITNGKFKIEGHLAFPHMTALVIIDDDNNVFEADWFYIEPGYQKLNIAVVNGQIELSSNAKVFTEFNYLYKPKIDFLDSIQINIKKSLAVLKRDSLNQGSMDSLNRLSDITSLQKALFLLDYVVENPKSYISLGEISASINGNRNIPIYETAFYFLDEALKQNHLGRQIVERIKHSKILSEGAIFPPIHLLDTNGEKAYLTNDKLQKYTLVDFWFHNCGACIAQFPLLKEIYAKHHLNGFQIIGITIDHAKSKDDWKEVIEKYSLPWLQLWDINGNNCKKYLITRFPTNYLLNEKGEIVEKDISLEKLNEFLAQKF